MTQNKPTMQVVEVDKVNPVKAMGNIFDALPSRLQQFLTAKTIKQLLPITIHPFDYCGYTINNIVITHIDFPDTDVTRIGNKYLIKDTVVEMACHVSGMLVETNVRAKAISSIDVELTNNKLTKFDVDITKFNYEVENGVILNMVLSVGSMFLGTISEALSDKLLEEADKFVHTEVPGTFTGSADGGNVADAQGQYKYSVPTDSLHTHPNLTDGH